MITLEISNIPRYIEKGYCNKFWYEQEASNLLEMLPEFSDLPIIKVFAVTSMTTSIEANVHLAIKALKQMRNNEEFQGYLPNHILYLNYIKQGVEVPGRKIGDFIEALEGDENSVVVDIWMTRAFGINNARILKDRITKVPRTYWKAPSKKEYDEIEKFCWEDCINYDLTPRQYQAALWCGIRKENKVIANNTWSSLLHKKRGMFNF